MNEPIPALEAYFAGHATEEQLRAVEAWINADPANAKAFMEQMHFREVLGQLLRERGDQSGLALVELARLEDQAESMTVTIHEDTAGWGAEPVTRQQWRDAVSYLARHTLSREQATRLAMAAALLFGVVLTIVLIGQIGSTEQAALEFDQPLVQQVPVVASVYSSGSAVWADPDTVKDGLRPAVEVELLSGLAEIRFKQGATLLVEGPATITPVDANAVKLKQGRLVAEVPPSAVGFEIDTYYGLIHDFGTEFGVSVDPMSGLNTQVYRGEIGVMARSTTNTIGPMSRLVADQAAEIRPYAAVVVEAEHQAARYLRRDGYDLLIKPDPTPAERWAAHLLQLEREHNLIAHLGFSGGSMQFKPGSAGNAMTAKWIGGEVRSIHGSDTVLEVLRLQGVPDQGIDLQMPGHSGYDKLTFIAWARIDPIPGQTNAPLLHHSRKDMPRSIPNWQLRPDFDRVDINQFNEGDTYLRGGRISASLHDIVWDQWHCFIAVLDAKTGQCDHYLDGRWVGSGQLTQKVPLGIDGLRIGSTGREVTQHPRTIKGEIALFTLLNTTLDDAGVRQVYEASSGLFN